jgi:glyoxylase-like metal-dependent hydrolase (beta-lactamase superfamily II)
MARGRPVLWLTDRVAIVASGANGFGLTHRSDCHVYLVDGGSEAALIDAGAGLDTDALLGNVEAAGIEVGRVRRLLVTHAHADHAGGAAALRERLELSVCASPEVAAILRAGDAMAASVAVGQRHGSYAPDYAYRATAVDEELGDGARVRVGDVEFEVVATPGHAVGHLCFVLHDRGRRDLFTGDTLLFGGRIILQDTWDCDLRTHLDSLRRLGRLDIRGLFPGHRTVSVSDGQRHVAAAVEAIDRGRVPPTL